MTRLSKKNSNPWVAQTPENANSWTVFVIRQQISHRAINPNICWVIGECILKVKFFTRKTESLVAQDEKVQKKRKR